jgi:hypothetical protein
VDSDIISSHSFNLLDLANSSFAAKFLNKQVKQFAAKRKG